MASPVDSKITARQLCGIVGVTHQTRRQWQDRGLVAPLVSGARLVDALELRAFVEINRALRPSEAIVAWAQVQPVLKSRIPGAEVDVVFDLQVRSARVVDTLDELAECVRIPHPIRVIRLGPALRETRDAFQILASPPPAPYPRVASKKSSKHQADQESA